MSLRLPKGRPLPMIVDRGAERIPITLAPEQRERVLSGLRRPSDPSDGGSGGDRHARVQGGDQGG